MTDRIVLVAVVLVVLGVVCAGALELIRNSLRAAIQEVNAARADVYTDHVAATVDGMNQAYIDSEFAAICGLTPFDRHTAEALDLTQDPKDQT